MNNITRYLASSVYTDQMLRGQIVDSLENNINAIANSPGLDVTEVLNHAYRANKRASVKYGVLLVGLLLCLFVPPIGLLISFFIVLYFKLDLENNILRRLFSSNNPNSGNISITQNVQSVMNRIKQQTCDNVIYYSGFSPFSGAGTKINAWSFAINIEKSKGGSAPQPFNISGIYEKTEKELKNLGFSNLTVEDRLIVNGRAIRQNNKLLANPLSFPLTSLPTNEIKPFMNLANKNARYYQMIQIRDWDDELILNIFFRVNRTDKFLFFETNYYILTPLKDDYKQIRSISSSLNFSQYLQIISYSSVATIFELIYCVFYWFGRLREGIDRLFHGGVSKTQRFILQNVKNNPDYNYGATMSIREIVASNLYQQYFHVLDKDMYMKIIEKKVLNSIEAFLDEKGIDTSEFRERETKILNEGIIITGGQINAQNIDIGKKETLIGKTIKSFNKTAD